MTAREVYAKFHGSVVRIDTDGGFGCGVVFRQQKWILTCAHVVDEAKKELKVTDVEGNELEVEGIAEDRNADVALIFLVHPATGEAMLPAGTGNLSVGDELFTIGSPKGLDDTLSTGIISALRTADGVSLVQISNAVTNGNSGGPAITADGLLAGIVSFTFDQSSNLNFAISAVSAERLLKLAYRTSLERFISQNAAQPIADKPEGDLKKRTVSSFEKTFWTTWDQMDSRLLRTFAVFGRLSAQSASKTSEQFKAIAHDSSGLDALCKSDVIANCPALKGGTADAYLKKMHQLSATVDKWLRSCTDYAEAIRHGQLNGKVGDAFLELSEQMGTSTSAMLDYLDELDAIDITNGFSMSSLSVGYSFVSPTIQGMPSVASPDSCLVDFGYGGPVRSGDLIIGVRPGPESTTTKVKSWTDLALFFLSRHYQGSVELEVKRKSKIVMIKINLADH